MYQTTSTQVEFGDICEGLGCSFLGLFGRRSTHGLLVVYKLPRFSSIIFGLCLQPHINPVLDQPSAATRDIIPRVYVFKEEPLEMDTSLGFLHDYLFAIILLLHTTHQRCATFQRTNSELRTYPIFGSFSTQPQILPMAFFFRNG